jgi:pyrroloquinoline quinone (PQQ) biosynthesis protein C
MQLAETNLAPRRVYATTTDEATGDVALTLSDAEVVLDRKGHALWARVADALNAGVSCADLPAALAQPAGVLAQALARFNEAGLLVRGDARGEISGADFYDKYFEPVLPAWLNEAFSHPFWDRMMSGQGSARLYAGWLIELYHYTRNANRHMPLAAANCRNKPVKALFAKHYEEEWSHFHFFSRAAAAMGIPAEHVKSSAPLPMTMEMSDFMRQAARTDPLCYAICSAVLEGTTTDGNSFNPFYEKVQQLYDVPLAAVKPIYDHLELDAKYQHANLFKEICEHEGTISRKRAAQVLDFGHQMVEHIWMWTDSIETYYSDPSNRLPRAQFDAFLD